jgi:hypothetical protein
MKITSFFKISDRCKILIVIAWFLSLYAFLLMKYFQKKAQFNRKKKILELKKPDSFLIKEIRTAIRVASKLSPWENVCRHQAYQAKMLCECYGINYKIFIGFKKDEENNIKGHAWTTVHDQIITGFCNPEEYQIQAIYS